MREYQLYIGGRWHPAGSGRVAEDINPADGRAWALVHMAGEKELEAALAGAYAAGETWAAVLPERREAILLKAAEVMLSRADELTEVLVTESGSAYAKAKGEVLGSAGIFRVAAGECRRHNTEILPPALEGQVSMTLRRPLGLILGITPFNYPLILAVKKLAYALAAGNTFLLKPSPHTPVISLLTAEILKEAGLPDHVLNVTPVETAEASGRLVNDPRVAMVSFTGSSRVGRRIAMDCAGNLKRYNMELGGKNPLILLEDYDLRQAAEIIGYGAFCHQGQVCMATSRVIAVGESYQAIQPLLVRRARSLKVGDPKDREVVVGPLIDQAHCAFIDGQIRDAVSKGATLLTGGRHQGPYYEPTVLAGVTPDMEIFYQETFGPVTSLIRAESPGEALALCNDNFYGLSAALLTNDLALAWELGQKIEAGMVHINDTTFLSATTAPSGGVKLSGAGREGGRYSMDEYTEIKWLTMQTCPRKMPF